MCVPGLGSIAIKLTFLPATRDTFIRALLAVKKALHSAQRALLSANTSGHKEPHPDGSQCHWRLFRSFSVASREKNENKTSFGSLLLSV